MYFNVALAHNEYVILFYSNYDDWYECIGGDDNFDLAYLGF